MKKILIGVGVIILLAVAGRAFWAYQHLTTKEEALDKELKSVSLKTYNDSQYGFEFQYPYESVNIRDCKTSREPLLNVESLIPVICIHSGPMNNSTKETSGFVGVFNHSLKIALKGLQAYREDLPSTNINDINWIKATLDTPDGSDYFTERNGRTFWVHGGKIGTSEAESLLRSFRFK